MSKTEILLLRHGESRGNVDKIFSGQVDVELTERGIAQAEAAADFLLTQSIDVICSSDLSRAFNTAKAFSVRSGIDISYVSKNLRELDAGSLDGIPMAEIIEKYDSDFSTYFTSRFGTYVFPMGESTFDAGMRMFNELKVIAEKYKNKRILIATHAGVIRSFWGIINHIPREDLGDKFLFPTNASVSRVDFDGVSFLPVSYSENDYLKGVGFIDYSKPRI